MVAVRFMLSTEFCWDSLLCSPPLVALVLPLLSSVLISLSSSPCSSSLSLLLSSSGDLTLSPTTTGLTRNREILRDGLFSFSTGAGAEGGGALSSLCGRDNSSPGGFPVSGSGFDAMLPTLLVLRSHTTGPELVSSFE
uniref:Uncharacterized protein n=1 Tax=Cacopsylla melanoneura TaxID=428564 RepID=A0A8D8Y5B3_9HEMI